MVVGSEAKGGEDGKTRYWEERRKKGNKLNAWRMRRWRIQQERSVPDRSNENTLLKVRIVTYIPYGFMNFLN